MKITFSAISNSTYFLLPTSYFYSTSTFLASGARGPSSALRPQAITLLVRRFRLRWRDRTTFSDGFSRLLGFSLGKRRSPKSWSKTGRFRPRYDPPQYRA